MRRSLWFFGLAVIVFQTGCYSGSRPQHIGSVAPDFTVQDSDRRVTLSDLRGQVVVIHFWATWCSGCVEEIPSLVRMQQRMKNKGVTVVAVSIDEDGDAYHQFLKEYGINFVTVRDPAKRVSALYGTFLFPETYIIDRKGVLRRKFIGVADWNSVEIVEFLGRL